MERCFARSVGDFCFRPVLNRRIHILYRAAMRPIRLVSSAAGDAGSAVLSAVGTTLEVAALTVQILRSALPPSIVLRNRQLSVDGTNRLSNRKTQRCCAPLLPVSVSG